MDSKQLVALLSSPRDNFHCFSVRLWTLFCRKLDGFGVVRVPRKWSVLLRKERARSTQGTRIAIAKACEKQKPYEAGDRSTRSVSPAFLCCAAFHSSFVLRFVEWQNLVGNGNFPQAVFGFAGNHIKVLFFQRYGFLLQVEELRDAAAVVDQHQHDLIVRVLRKLPQPGNLLLECLPSFRINMPFNSFPHCIGSSSLSGHFLDATISVGESQKISNFLSPSDFKLNLTGVCNTHRYFWSPFSSAAFFIFSIICRSSSLRR